MLQQLRPLQPTSQLLILLLVLSIATAWILIARRLESNDPETQRLKSYVTFGQWPSFFARFGLLQLGACILAMLIGGAGMEVRSAEAAERTTVQELTVSPTDAKPSLVNVAGSSNVAIHAVVAEPAGAAATLVISDASDSSAPVRRLRVMGSKWTVWQGDPGTEELHISASKPDDATLKPATSLKVLVTTRRAP